MEANDPTCMYINTFICTASTSHTYGQYRLNINFSRKQLFIISLALFSWCTHYIRVKQTFQTNQDATLFSVNTLMSIFAELRLPLIRLIFMIQCTAYLTLYIQPQTVVVSTLYRYVSNEMATTVLYTGVFSVSSVSGRQIVYTNTNFMVEHVLWDADRVYTYELYGRTCSMGGRSCI